MFKIKNKSKIMLLKGMEKILTLAIIVLLMPMILEYQNLSDLKRFLMTRCNTIQHLNLPSLAEP
jgi:hypothetical protein